MGTYASRSPLRQHIKCVKLPKLFLPQALKPGYATAQADCNTDLTRTTRLSFRQAGHCLVVVTDCAACNERHRHDQDMLVRARGHLFCELWQHVRVARAYMHTCVAGFPRQRLLSALKFNACV